MDQLQKEHERLWKRLKSSKNIKDVQATIDMLQEARDTIAAGKLFDSFFPVDKRATAQAAYGVWLTEFSTVKIQVKLRSLWPSYRTQ